MSAALGGQDLGGGCPHLQPLGTPEAALPYEKAWRGPPDTPEHVKAFTFPIVQRAWLLLKPLPWIKQQKSGSRRPMALMPAPWSPAFCRSDQPLTVSVSTDVLLFCYGNLFSFLKGDIL